MLPQSIKKQKKNFSKIGSKFSRNKENDEFSNYRRKHQKESIFSYFSYEVGGLSQECMDIVEPEVDFYKVYTILKIKQIYKGPSNNYFDREKYQVSETWCSKNESNCLSDPKKLR